MSELRIRVLGPVEVEIDGTPVRISKPRLREMLCLLVIARGRTVRTSSLVDDLWEDAPAGALGIVQTFVGELRKILEPGRPARTPPTTLVTRGAGYALVLAADAVDLWRAEQLVRDDEPEHALELWSGHAFEEFADRAWATGERARIAELRAGAVERRAEARIAEGKGDSIIASLDCHVDEHPWREEGWRLLALALYGAGRQGDSIEVLRRARETFVRGLGLDPSDRLASLEQRILTRDSGLLSHGSSVLMQTAAAQARGGARSQIESATALLPLLAQSGSVDAATEQRVATIRAAEQFGDPELTARVIVGYDVPGVWTRSDDPAKSAAIVEAADRTLAILPPTASTRVRARLLATIAMESRGVDSRMDEAQEAERLARTLADPALLCLALSARYLQSCGTTGLADVRELLGSEIIGIAVGSELSTFEIAGRLIRMQALCALDDIRNASVEADLVDGIAARFDRPLASVFTAWFRYTFTGGPPAPDGDEMPGFRTGLTAMSALTTALRNDTALPRGDFGPYAPWAEPLLATDAEASGMLETVPDPPHDLMAEICWYLVGTAALRVGHHGAARRAHAALLPAVGERAAGSGALDLGPIGPLVTALE